MLDADRHARPAERRPEPVSLVGVASDGRPLESLAYGAVIGEDRRGRWRDDGQSLDHGGDWLDLMTKLQVADAAGSWSA